MLSDVGHSLSLSVTGALAGLSASSGQKKEKKKKEVDCSSCLDADDLIDKTATLGALSVCI